jgi:PAS domain S-box-containing protein
MSDSIKDFTDLAGGERLREELRSMCFTSAGDAIVIINVKGTIIEANPQVTTFFWYTRDELLGASVDMLVPESARTAHAEHREVYTDNPVVKAMGIGRILKGRRKDGKEFQVEVSINPLPHRNEMFFMASVRKPAPRE